MNWCRLWHDLPNDPKFRTIARLSNSRTSDVISVFIHLMVAASANATERGRTQSNADDLASALDLETERVKSILEAMQGRVLDGEILTGWSNRQVKHEDGSAERAKKWREMNKLDTSAENTNATERNRTQENTRRDETRRDTDKETDSEQKYSAVTEVNVSLKNHSTTNGRNGHISDLTNGIGKKPFVSPLKTNQNSTDTRPIELYQVLHDYMAMTGTPYERKVKPPDKLIVDRCMDAIGHTPISTVATFLRDRFVNYEQSPRHPNGPRGYAWFSSVLLAEFKGHQ